MSPFDLKLTTEVDVLKELLVYVIHTQNFILILKKMTLLCNADLVTLIVGQDIWDCSSVMIHGSLYEKPKGLTQSHRLTVMTERKLNKPEHMNQIILNVRD